jgi:hypothetical protein
MSERMKEIVARAAGTGEQIPAALYFAVEAIGVLAEEVDALCELLAPGSTTPTPTAAPGAVSTPAPIAHEAAVAKLRAQRFDWMKQVGSTIVDPPDRCLTYQPGCCHGWIEISGEPGLVGPIVMRVDGGFPLRFPSLVDLVAHLPEDAA